jgi:MFS family permease
VRNVLLTEATTPETYGRAFGLERAMDSAGAVIGPLLALVIVATLGLRWVFLLTLLPGTAAALLIALLVREKPHQPQPQRHLLAGFASLPRPFRRFLVGVGIAGLGDFSNTLLILWATQAWMPQYGPARAATMAMGFYAIAYNVPYTLCCYVSGSLADRLPKHKVLGGGYLLALIPAVALLWPGASLGKFLIVFAFSGIYTGVWETLESTTAATILPAHVRGTGFGLLATVNGFGDFLSSASVGFLWALHPVWAMLFVIVTSLVGAGIILGTPTAAVGATTSPVPAEMADSMDPPPARPKSR